MDECPSRHGLKKISPRMSVNSAVVIPVVNFAMVSRW